MFIKILPKSGESKPVIKLNIVDLPTPLGPNNPNICPLFNLKFKLSKIIFLPNLREILSSFKILRLNLRRI